MVALKQSINLAVSQQLTLTPQLKQSLNLLQLSSVDLDQEVQTELDSNPLLERLEQEATDYQLPPEHTPLQDNQIPQPIAESSDPDAELMRTDNLAAEQDLANTWQESFKDIANQRVAPIAHNIEFEIAQISPHATTLIEHLLWQLQMTKLGPRDKEIGSTIIHNLDEDGYLVASAAELSAQLGQLADLEEDEIEAVLKLIKTFEPTGVGARNVSERLLLLLAQHKISEANTDSIAEIHELAEKIISDHLGSLGQRQFGHLQKQLSISKNELARAVQLITRLQPRIALQFSQDQQDHIIPDVIVDKKSGHWAARINPANQIRLRVNDLYANLVTKQSQEGLNDADSEYIQNHVAQAKTFIKGLMSRYDTLLLVGQTIVERQQVFFDQGEQAMQPMVLSDIAQTLELHESTISRATAGKYLLCPRGVFELKYFFSSALTNTEGTASSSTAIRSLIKEMVDAECKSKPLSDSKIAKKLEEQGHIVARRTVAKYRESLQIAPSSQRKALQIN